MELEFLDKKLHAVKAGLQYSPGGRTSLLSPYQSLPPSLTPCPPPPQPHFTRRCWPGDVVQFVYGKPVDLLSPTFDPKKAAGKVAIYMDGSEVRSAKHLSYLRFPPAAPCCLASAFGLSTSIFFRPFSSRVSHAPFRFFLMRRRHRTCGAYAFFASFSLFLFASWCYSHCADFHSGSLSDAASSTTPPLSQRRSGDGR